MRDEGRLCQLWLCFGLCVLQAAWPLSPSNPGKVPRCGQELGPGPYWEAWLGPPAAGGAGEGEGEGLTRPDKNVAGEAHGRGCPQGERVGS